MALKVGFISLSEALDLTTPSGRAFAGMLAVFAEFEPDILRDLWSYALQRRSFEWCKTLNPSDKSLPIDRARLIAMGAMLERNGSMSSPAIGTRLSLAPSSPSNQRKLARTLQRLLFFLFVIPPLLFFVIGDFPFTARLQNAFATPIVFRTLIYLLIASTLRQIEILIGQALALSDMRNNESKRLVTTAFIAVGNHAWQPGGQFEGCLLATLCISSKTIRNVSGFALMFRENVSIEVTWKGPPITYKNNVHGVLVSERRLIWAHLALRTIDVA